MRVVNKAIKKKPFECVVVGRTFIYDKDVYIKVGPFEGWNAAQLSGAEVGALMKIDDDSEVLPREFELNEVNS